ncbi:MAG: Lrp/AsnC family transcriptional regulator, partial [Pseudomonas sp.]
MDSFDQHILTLLQRDASTSLKELAEAVNLTTTPCWKRVKRLQDDGYILGRVALLDPQRLGLGLTVFVQLKTQRHDNAWLEQFAATVSGFEEVMEFYRMS